MGVGGAVLSGIVGQEVADLTGAGGFGTDGVGDLFGLGTDGGGDISGNTAVADALSAYYANAAGSSAADYANVSDSTTAIDNLASMYSQLGMSQSDTAAAVANVTAAYSQLGVNAAVQSAVGGQGVVGTGTGGYEADALTQYAAAVERIDANAIKLALQARGQANALALI